VTDLQTYVINLDGSNDRLNSATAHLNAAGIAFERHSAFDGRKMDPLECAEYDEERAISWFGRKLTGGEIGCYLSQVAVAKRIVEDDADFGLILEDDLTVQGDARGVLDQVIDFLSPADGPTPAYMVNLGRPVKRFYTPVLDLGAEDTQLCHAPYFPDTNTAVLWSAEAARAFLDAAFPIYMPVDHFLRRWGAETGIGLGLTKVPFTPSGTSSEIDSTKSRDDMGRARFYHLRKHRRLWINKHAAKQKMAALQSSQYISGLDVLGGKLDQRTDLTRQATTL
jgi:glycosyl transferase family 25